LIRVALERIPGSAGLWLEEAAGSLGAEVAAISLTTIPTT
jgi:hypothetical protein